MLGSIADFDHLRGCGVCRWVVPSTQPPQRAAAACGACAASTGSVGIGGGGGSLVRMRKENFILVRKGEETVFFFVEFYPDTFDTSNMSHQSLCVIEKMNEYFRYLGFSSPKIINIYSFLQLAARKNWGKNTQLPRTRFRGFLRGPGQKRRWDDDFLHFGRKAAVARLLGLWQQTSRESGYHDPCLAVARQFEGFFDECWRLNHSEKDGRGQVWMEKLWKPPCLSLFFFWLAVFNWFCWE